MVIGLFVVFGFGSWIVILKERVQIYVGSCAIYISII